MDLSKINISSYLPTMPYKVRELFDKATNIVMNYSETEAKVIEATNDESWGPPGKLLQDLSQLSYSSENYNEIMGILWKRCFSQDKRYWRRIYKSLLVLTYLIKNGNEKIIKSIREHLTDLKNLENFIYHDEHNKDQGINIRHKVKELIEFVQDEDRIRIERKRARANRDKYIGISNEESSSYRSKDQNDEEYNSNKKTEHWKTDDLKDDEIEEDNQQNSKSTWIYISKDNNSTVEHSANNQTPIVDLLGEEIDYKSNVQDSQDDEFGQFQEAVSPVQWSSSNIFDPFAPSETSTYECNTFINQIPSNINQTNIWSSTQDKLDISLNNLIPHTRGNSQKNALPLNQLTSPTNSIYNTQSIFSNNNRN